MLPREIRRKILGQHFLSDAPLAEKIAQEGLRLAQEAQCQAVLEIGPGRGALTDRILKRNQASSQPLPILVSERDPVLARQWADRSQSDSLLTCYPGDFLDLKESELPPLRPLAVISNLPYSSATAILLQLHEWRNSIPVMLLMFQREVGQRLRAQPSSKSWGSLSLWIQNHWDVSLFESVSPRSFSPPPKVESEVVLLRRRPAPRIQAPQNAAAPKLWESLLKTSFLHRRKMLRSSLRGHPIFSKAWEEAGLDGTLRAESLDWPQWQAFFDAASRLKNLSPDPHS